jgi:hypothetical protein
MVAEREPPTMPNIMIRGQELRNVTAYILSLKD